MAPTIPHREKKIQDLGKTVVLRKRKQIPQKPEIPKIRATIYPLFITSKASSSLFSSELIISYPYYLKSERNTVQLLKTQDPKNAKLMGRT